MIVKWSSIAAMNAPRMLPASEESDVNHHSLAALRAFDTGKRGKIMCSTIHITIEIEYAK